jgi:MoaA/NifB/PqqE/SkfB family radical SAM enzyme
MSSTAETVITAADPNPPLPRRHVIQKLPVLVLFPHNRCNCRCMMCDIWRIRQTREITARDLEPHLTSLRALQVRWVVLSGGEPQLHSDLSALTSLFRTNGLRVTLLTAGLLLEAHAASVADTIDDVIVSLDGPPEIHNQIRGVPRAFELLAKGVEAVRRHRPGIVVNGRSTVQKSNFRYLRETVRTAKEIGLNSISFLPADLVTDAFNRTPPWPTTRQAAVALDSEEVNELDQEISLLTHELREDIAGGYIVESAEKLRRIGLHFRAYLGQTAPVAPRCNAPWVSAIIESDGTVRPCFFHRALGNLHALPLLEILNSPDAVEFRRNLKIPENPVCQRCVCSLYIPLGA